MTSHLEICKQEAPASANARNRTPKRGANLDEPGVATSFVEGAHNQNIIGVPDQSSTSECISLPLPTWIFNPELQDNLSPSDKARRIKHRFSGEHSAACNYLGASTLHGRNKEHCFQDKPAHRSQRESTSQTPQI